MEENNMVKSILDDIANALREFYNEFPAIDIKNVKTGEQDIGMTNMDGVPNKVIFNGDYTILKYDDENIKVKRSKEDVYDPVIGFLYGYFYKNSGASRNVANKLLDMIREIGKSEEKNKEEEIEKLLDENLDLEAYFEKFKKIMNNK